MKRALAALCAAWLGASAPRVAGATTVVPVTTEELAARSDLVVVATARSASSRWDGGVIVTDVEVVVDASLRGAAAVGTSLVVRVAGGTVGRIRQSVADAPELEVGRSYLLFLAGGAGGARFLAHLTAGALALSVSPGADATVLVPAALVTEVRATAAPAMRSVSLETLAARVRDVRR